MRILRLIMGVTMWDRLRNDYIREQLGVESVLVFIERSQLRWYGHVMRMEDRRYPLKYYNWRPEGRRPVGRPRKRWRDAINEAVTERGTTLNLVEETEMYDDRSEWRNFAGNHR